jgi:hypothetical protein
MRPMNPLPARAGCPCGSRRRPRVGVARRHEQPQDFLFLRDGDAQEAKAVAQAHAFAVADDGHAQPHFQQGPRQFAAAAARQDAENLLVGRGLQPVFDRPGRRIGAQPPFVPEPEVRADERGVFGENAAAAGQEEIGGGGQPGHGGQFVHARHVEADQVGRRIHQQEPAAKGLPERPRLQGDLLAALGVGFPQAHAVHFGLDPRGEAHVGDAGDLGNFEAVHGAVLRSGGGAAPGASSSSRDLRRAATRKPESSTAMMGKTEPMVTTPNASAAPARWPMPSPAAMTSGTVMGPVVTPAQSQAMAAISSEEKTVNVSASA